MMLTSISVAHLAQGGMVAAVSEVVQATTSNTTSTLITAIGGIVGIAVANFITSWFKQRRGDDDETAAENRRLKRANTTLKREKAKLERELADAKKPPTRPVRRPRKEAGDATTEA